MTSARTASITIINNITNVATHVMISRVAQLPICDTNLYTEHAESFVCYFITHSGILVCHLHFLIVYV